MHKFWSVVFGLMTVLGVLLFVIAAFIPGWWLPRQVSTTGGSADGLFYMILWITAITFVLTEAVLVWNIYSCGNPEAGRKAPYIHGNHKLEIIWTIVPSIILILVAVLQISSWEKIKYAKNFPPADGNTCQMVVVARQWEWRVRYPSPDDMRAWEKDKALAKRWSDLADYPFEDLPQYDDIHAVNEIHCWAPNDVQKSAPVLVHLKTRDVLHSFFLPTLRLKQDAVPGKVIPVWFELLPEHYNVERDPKTSRWVVRNDPEQGTTPYAWDLACAEFCGARHSMMRGQLYVHKNKADFMQWLEQAQAEQNKGKPSKPLVAAAQ